MDRGAWWATVHGVAMSRTQLNDFTFTFPFYNFPLQGRQGSRGCIPGSPGVLLCWPREVHLPFGLRGKAGECSRVTAGQKRPQLALCKGPFSQGYGFSCGRVWMQELDCEES